MKNNDFKLVYFMTRPLFLGLIFSLTFKSSLQDSLISYVIGTILGCILIYFINKCDINKRKFLQLILYILFILLSTLILQTFISSFYLVNTPKIIISIPWILMCIYLSSKNIKEIRKNVDVLFIISIIFYITIFLLLTKYINVSNIMPLFITPIKNIFESSITFAILTSAPNILLVNENIPTKKHIISYIITCLICISIGFIILASLTPNVAKIYSYPEYMILKRIKIFEFIENVENILSFYWYFDMFIFTTLTLKRIKEIVKKNSLFYLILIATTIFITYFISSSYYRVLILYHYSTYIIGIVLLSIILFNKKSPRQ